MYKLFSLVLVGTFSRERSRHSLEHRMEELMLLQNLNKKGRVSGKLEGGKDMVMEMQLFEEKKV